ncbi:MAG: NAD(+) synthase [Bacillota bacterium]
MSLVAERCDRLVTWLRQQAAEAGVEGAVVGLSGGIDSAVVAGLCRRAFGEKVLGVIMPCHSDPQDAEHARLLADAFGIEARTVVLDDVYDQFLALLSLSGKGEPPRLAVANLKPRLRMITLYYHANSLGYLVVGTGNKSEATVGYFTKYGDGGVDLLPIGNLVKQEVRELADHLGVPQPILDKPPSAGLWGGQTDETEMGITYEVLDRYILTGEAPPPVAQRIQEMNRRSEHKRRLPPAGPR